MICSFSKDFSSLAYTTIENSFIKDYMPLSSGDAVKVYLYGLYLCNHPELDFTITDISKALSLSEDTIRDCFLAWEEFGIISVTSNLPFTVIYLPISSSAYSKPRKYKADKYADFSKALQALIPSRMISTGEFTEYYNIMETYSIKPEAMLLIVKYCVDRKGETIGYHYISKVAKDFGNRGIITIEKVEDEVSGYIAKTAEISTILKALSIRRQPDIDDQNLYKKWTSELKFELSNIVYAAKAMKKGSMTKLDEFLLELYSMKSFSKAEISEYIKNKQNLYELAIKINKGLAIYVEVIDTVVENYVKKWVAVGFTENSLLLIANHLFKTGNNNLPAMDALVESLRVKGFIDFSAICDYFENQRQSDEFISKILINCALNRRPTPWDRENLSIWKTWNFSEEMILEASKLASGKANPIAYINAILSSWKNKGIYTVQGAVSSPQETTQEEYNREYTRRRTLAVTRAQKNVEKAMEIEGFSKFYERLFSIEKDLAFAEISGEKEKLEALEKEKQDCEKSAGELLKKVGLTIADLSPKYACEKCNDTGYVNTRRCDCYDKKVN